MPDFAKEAVGHKNIGRTMIEMTLDLNKRHFEGCEAVTCFTCYRGQKHPTATIMNEPKVVTSGVKQARVNAEQIRVLLFRMFGPLSLDDLVL